MTLFYRKAWGSSTGMSVQKNPEGKTTQLFADNLKPTVSGNHMTHY